MKAKLLFSLPLCTVAGLFSSCSTSNVNETLSQAHVRLEQANYRVVATQVKGSATGFHVATILPTNANDIRSALQGGPLGGFPVVSASEAKAIDRMYKNAGDQRNRATALINIRREVSGLNMLLFSIPRVTVTGDLVEFIR